MKKLCITSYVFQKNEASRNYYEYVALYAYSIFMAYPQYHVRLYLEGEPLPNVRALLEKVGKLGNLSVVENYRIPMLNRERDYGGDLGKASRWLLCDDSLREYDALYIGDVDFFICPEKEPLFEGHMRHCEYLNLPYSNIVRAKTRLKKETSAYLKSCRKKYGLVKTLQYKKTDMSHFKLLSGLHFVQTKPYFEKVAPIIPQMINDLNGMYKWTSPYWNPCFPVYNEHILYRLIGLAGLPYPGQLSSDGWYGKQLPQDGPLLNYRPHHGLHLGIFRSKLSAEQEIIALSDEYIGFYRYFRKLLREDALIAELAQLPLLKDAIERMSTFYSSKGVDP